MIHIKSYFRNPTSTKIAVEWKQFTDKERYCLIIDKELKCILNVDAENMKFWENIYDEIELI